MLRKNISIFTNRLISRNEWRPRAVGWALEIGSLLETLLGCWLRQQWAVIGRSKTSQILGGLWLLWATGIAGPLLQHLFGLLGRRSREDESRR